MPPISPPHAGPCSAPFAAPRARCGPVCEPNTPGDSCNSGMFSLEQEAEAFPPPAAAMLAERVLQSHRFLFSRWGGASRHLAARRLFARFFGFLVVLVLNFCICQCFAASTDSSRRQGGLGSADSAVHAQPFSWCCPLGAGEVGGRRSLPRGMPCAVVLPRAPPGEDG